MTTFGAQEPSIRPHVRDMLLYLVGVAGLAFALTSVWLGMRSVMDIGGSCASGGPYVTAVECPPGVDVLLILAFPLGFAAVGLMVWKGVLLGGPYAGLAALAWPILFLSLGWNFLEYAFRPPGGGGLEWGWLIPGVIFVLMGGIPLLGWFGARGHGPIVPGVLGTTTPIEIRDLSRAMRNAYRMASLRAGNRAGSMTVSDATASPSPGSAAIGLVSELERLSRLHTDGAITDTEYDGAKRALISAASRGEL